MAEQKYESIKSVNLALESSILQLRHQVEINRSRQSRRRQIAQLHDPSPTGAAHSSTAPGYSASPGSPPSFSSISGGPGVVAVGEPGALVTPAHFAWHSAGASNDQLSVSLAVEASEGLNELYWHGLESSALAEAPDLPLESGPVAERRRSSVASASAVHRQ